jgi:hypothetical protein
MSSPLRSLRSSRDEVLSLEVLAHRTPAEPQQRTQFQILVRHFLERFFAGEVSAVDGDTRTRLVQIACALGVPPLVISLYLYPAYHLPQHALRPYWAQVGDHYFYVVYAMVCMGVVTIFEWDLLFPDLLDVYLLSVLPVQLARLLWSRIAAIFLLMGAALFDSSFLAPVVLPAATDPPGLFRFLCAHLVAVAAAGTFGAAFFLALEGALIGLLGDRLFRRVSLWLQGACVLALLTLLFLYPVVCGAIHGLIASRSRIVLCTPPLWFLGIYQRLLDGPAVPPQFEHLAHVGVFATFTAVALSAITYPLAWWRKTRGLVEGAARRERGLALGYPIQRVLHATAARTPSCRAIWHFIGQNLLRVPRYRMVLVMYGGMGAALVLAAILRVSFSQGHIHLIFAPRGLRAAIPIVAFWTVSGLRSTFLAPVDQRGQWIFRVTLGRAGVREMFTAQRWVWLWALLPNLVVIAWAHFAQPAGHRNWMDQGTLLLTAAALSLLLTDAFFLNVTTIPFTGTRSGPATNLALLRIPYLGFFPGVVLVAVSAESWIEASIPHLAMAALIVAAVHLGLSRVRRARHLAHLQQVEPDEDEEDFPLRLGLRY